MNRKIEILAPAGGEEALRAAVFAGADAIYLGGTAFGARAAAQNFTREQLKEAAAFCRGRDVRLYVAVNTLLKEEELPGALEFVKFLCALPVDAVIVQDMGLFYALRRFAPELFLHASTQMSLHGGPGAAWLRELGAKRVVLARELSLAEIREVAAETDIELEVFVHGALCMCVSGQCYFSAALGSRSGNRGMCAQPCRLPFAAQNGTGHDLSLKDLMLAQEVAALQEAGVASAKIEGRMKRPEYVAAAVDTYQSAAMKQPMAHLEELSAVFNRSGFTKGYFQGKTGREMFGIRKKADAAPAGVLAILKGLYRGEKKRVEIAIAAYTENGRVLVQAKDALGHEASAAAPAGQTENLARARCVQQLEKTGGTPFFAAETDCPAGGLPITVSALNALRRTVLEGLLEKRTQTQKIPFALSEAQAFFRQPAAEKPKEQLQLRGAFRHAAQIPAQAAVLEKLYLPLQTPVQALQADFLRPETVIFELPRAIFGKAAQARVLMEMQQWIALGYRDFACASLDGLALCRAAGGNTHGLFGLNITNSAALRFFQEAGLADAELSMELSAGELAQLRGTLPKGLMLYGRQALMLTRNCPLKNRGSCKGCGGAGQLTDRMNKQFPVMCTKTGETGYAEVFNSLPLSLWNEGKKLAPMDFGILRFTVESSVECGEAITGILRQEKPGYNCTRGLFHRGVE